MCLFVVFLFFKQKTAYEMRISDWSSDVCSSELRSALAIVETDVETGMRVARDDVAGRIVDLEVGHLKVRRLEPFRAFVQRHGFQRGEDAGEARDRLVGQVRVGGRLLRSLYVAPHLDR